MDLNPALQTFVAESTELLEQMEQSLLQLESDASDRELLDAVFRAAHTIKGSAGLFGFDAIVAFTHGVESLLDRLRNGEIAMSADLSAVLLRCGDHIATLIECLAGDSEAPAELLAEEAGLRAELARFGSAAAPVAPAPGPSGHGAVTAAETASETWHISLRFGPEVLRNGMDPLSFLRYLGTLGELVEVVTLTDALPPLADLDPETCHLGFEIRLRSAADKATIESVFDFVRDDCRIRILPPGSLSEAYLDLIAESPENAVRLGEILVGCGAITANELAAGLAVQSAEGDVGATAAPAAGAEERPRPLGEILVAEGAVSEELVSAALDRQQQVRQQKQQESRLIRVDADKLDQLITLVGELVIAGSGVHAVAHRAGMVEIVESATTLARLVEEVRDCALGLRMVQIGPTFQRFQRVVRDVSREIGKHIELEITGGDTELDKSVVERIGDPLMHLVRNAMDHGIEAPAARAAAGKPARARLALHAYHDSGSIVIEVSDDGAGLNVEKIRQKAIARGLLGANATPSTAEIQQLIFEPGFSTADAVSNLSGRGVGMDVVRRNIESLRGTIEIESESGRGTTIRIRLPLTLAIIDGFLVGLGAARYVLPLDVVVECMELSVEDRRAVTDKGFLNVRGEALPVLRLRDAFQIGSADCRRENIVVVRFGSLKAGLVVDELLGELQTVIKPLGKLFTFLQGISGSTILGSGEVALILDVPGLIKRAEADKAQAAHVA